MDVPNDTPSVENYAARPVVDVLARVDQLLDRTPEYQLATPPLPRPLVAAIAAEIRRLRAKIAAKEAGCSS